MNKFELAALLNGREMGHEISKSEQEEVKQNNLVIVFGASDDLMEFRGAIRDDISAYGGATAYLNSDGLMINKCHDDCPYHAKQIESATNINAIWDSEGYSWVYETTIPHETFDILEDGEPYCRGIVFSLDDVKGD